MEVQWQPAQPPDQQLRQVVGDRRRGDAGRVGRRVQLARPISMANKGLPAAVRTIRDRSGRRNSWCSRDPTIRPSTGAVRPSRATTVARSSGSSRSHARCPPVPSTRSVARSRTGSAESRRTAYWTAGRWRYPTTAWSSMATSTGPAVARRRNRVSTAAVAARAGDRRESAASMASRCGPGSPASTASSTSANRSARPTPERRTSGGRAGGEDPDAPLCGGQRRGPPQGALADTRLAGEHEYGRVPLRTIEELIDDGERGGSPEDWLRQVHCAIGSPAAPRYQTTPPGGRANNPPCTAKQPRN